MGGGNVGSLKSIFENKQRDLIQGDQRIRAGLAQSKSVRQQLSTAPLLAASCDSRNNPVLKSLWEAVRDYNAQWQHPTKMSMEQTAHAVAILDFIYQVCASYMTSKSMKTLKFRRGPAKRQARYNAFTGLLTEVAKEIDAHGRQEVVGSAELPAEQTKLLAGTARSQASCRIFDFGKIQHLGAVALDRYLLGVAQGQRREAPESSEQRGGL